MPSRCLLGIEFEKFGFTLHAVLAEISSHISRKEAWVVIVVNLHAMFIMRKDKELQTAYRNADKIIFDGISAI